MKIRYKGAALYPAQRAAIFAPERISVIEASTKAGKTIGCLAWLAEKALTEGREGRNYWWVAPVYSQAEIGYRRMKLKLPNQLFKPNESKLRLTLANGAVIDFRSAEKPDGLYGEDVYAAVLDEASRMREAAWHAVRSTLTATRGPVRIIGNVRGRKNWMWQLARMAEAGEPGMSYHRLTAYDAIEAGVLAKEEIEDAQRMFEGMGLPEVFRELYMAEASAAGSNPFGLDAIDDCVTSDLSSRDPRAAGVDLAGRGAYNITDRGGERGDRDWTAIVMLDRDGVATHVERFRYPHGETEAALMRIVKRTPCLMDSTGAGDPIVEWCQRTGKMNVEGFVFGSRTKQDLMEGLAVAIQNRLVRFPDGELRDELDSFQFEYSRSGMRYSAPPNQHDDLVCALALAVKKMPWKRGHLTGPMGIPQTSTWHSSPDGEAWRAYQESKHPATQGIADEEKAVNVPEVVTGEGAGKWR